MKVLFTTPILEHPAAGGSQLRIENSIKALSSVCELHLLARTTQSWMGGKAAEDFYRSVSHRFSFTPSVVGLSSNRYLRKLQKIWRSVAHVDLNHIDDYIKREQIDLVWFGYGNVSFPLIKGLKKRHPQLKMVCDTDSVFSRYILRELPYESSFWRRLKIKRAGQKKEAEEREWVNVCEVTTAVSEVDAAYYREFCRNGSSIRIFSNVIDLNTYQSGPPKPPEMKSPSIYLAGTFGPLSPMDKAARWVIEHVWPRLKAKIPNLSFYIVGTGSKETLADIHGPDIHILGKLPSVLPYLCHTDVALVPLKFESGTRFKILEAGACGVPIVSTTLGAEGLPVIDGKHILIADEPESFSAAIERLLSDQALRQLLAQNCRDLVQEGYSVQALTKQAEEILRELK
jgi:polysaccharide biosynthesis protein PslH